MKRIALVLALVASVGCGGKVEEVTDTAGGGSSGSPAPTTTTTAVPPPLPSPGQPTPLPPPPKDPSPSKKLSAQAMPGGLDHLVIFAADATADSCVRIHMTSPFSASPSSPYQNVLTPKEWGIRGISRSPGAKRCGPGKQPPAAEEATDAKGNITFAPTSSVYPCSIDVHVVALFGSSPTTEEVDGDKIAVEGCQ